MIRFIFFASIVIMNMVYISSGNCQESVFIKHSCKIINHGYFTFCSVDDKQVINKITFSYSLDLKKKSYTIMLISNDTLHNNKDCENCLKGFIDSDNWNKERLGTSVEKYFEIFHKDFLRWSNSEKLDFFKKSCKIDN